MELRWELYHVVIFTLTATQCQGCEPFWIRCPGNISVLGGTDARFDWSHNISGEVDIRWLHKGKTIMDYSGGVTGPSRRRADYIKDAPGSATMILKNVTSADAGVYEVRVVNPPWHHPPKASLTVIEGADVVVHIKIDGILWTWSLDKNGTNIALPNQHKEALESFSVEVEVSETAPTPDAISVYLNDKDGQPLEGESFCNGTKLCKRQLTPNATNADILNILIDFNIQNMEVIHVRQAINEPSQENTEYKYSPLTTPRSKGHISQPTIRIKNRLANTGMTLNLPNLSYTSVVVTTEEPTNVTVKYRDILKSCTKNTMCSVIVDLSDPQGNITVQVTVSFTDHLYQSCFTILTNPDINDETSGSSKIIAILISLLALVVTVLVVVVVVMRKEMLRRLWFTKEDAEKNECSDSSALNSQKKDELGHIPHSDITEPLIEERRYVPEAPSDPNVAVQLHRKVDGNVRGLNSKGTIAPSLSCNADRALECSGRTELRPDDPELPGTCEAEPEYQEDRQSASEILGQSHRTASDTEYRQGENPVPTMAMINIKVDENEKARRIVKCQQMAIDRKKKRGKKTVREDKGTTAHNDQLESGTTPDTPLLTEPDEWVILPSPVPENRMNVAVVKPQPATAETEEPKNPPFFGAFKDQSQREQIAPLLFPRSVS